MNLICRDDDGILRIKQMIIDIRNDNTCVHGNTSFDS